jgi:phytoene dehydrogenase-like protein
MKPDVVIIGGGVAGLACGCYLQMNGYRTEILEMNNSPGGLCVAWDRGPYTFDGCMRWLVGTDPASMFYRVWKELGAIDGREVLHRNEILRVEGREGQVLSVSADLDQFARDCRRLAPEDTGLIDKLVRAARCCGSFDPPEKAMELMTIREKTWFGLQFLPMLWTLGMWMPRPLGSYVNAYRNPLLREVLMALAGHPRMSALVLVMVLSWRAGRNAGYVAGGSRAFTQGIATRYAGLGGVIRFNVPVSSVTVENNRATGVRCADGTDVRADTVVSCADAYTTIFKMLGGRYVTRQIRRLYQNGDVFPGLLQASFGINQSFPDAPQALSLPLSRPIKVDDLTRHDRMEVTVFGADSGFCPAGKTVMIVRLFTRFDYWAKLRDERPAEYTEAKEDLLRALVGVLDQRFSGVASRLEHADLATPATFARFTGNWQGSFQGWLPTPRILGRRLPRSLPGLKNFYLAGHWLDPGGGLPPAALSARYVAQVICARDGKVFTTTPACASTGVSANQSQSCGNPISSTNVS